MISVTEKNISILTRLVLIVSLVHVVSSAGITPDGQGRRLLVLLDNFGIRDTHSTLFKSFKDRGFQVTYKMADDSDLALSKYNEYLFDHVALFCPNVVEFGGNITTKSIIDFIDAGGNVLVAASPQLTEPVKEIAGECGVEFSDEDTFVIDRFNTDSNDDGMNTLIAVSTDDLINNQIIVGNAKKNAVPLLYRGIGLEFILN
jgi:oligosaccharyltransferase complex subunit beta